MTTLTIQIPERKAELVKQLLKELGVTIKVSDEKGSIPNKETLAAMKELKAGKGKKFKNVDALFASI